MSAVDIDGPRIIRPFPDSPQELLVASIVREAAYCGGRGRGGTFGIALSQYRNTVHPKFRGLILRRTVPELSDLVDKCSEIYRSDNRVKFNLTDRRFSFPSGATIWLSALERHEDWRRFHGHAYQEISWDELGNWEEERTYLIMMGSLRAPGRFMPCTVRSNFNPGGPGAQWVKRRFVDPAPFGTIIYDGRIKPERRVPELTGRICYHGTFRDNPTLYNEDYESTLDSMPANLTKQMKEGRFDVFEGQEFPDFDPAIHVIKPFAVPRGNDRKSRSTDYGMSGSCTLWWIRDSDGNLTCYDELYTVGVNAEHHAEMIKKREETRGENINGVLDSACFAEHGHAGPTIAQSFWDKGVRVFRSQKNRAMACEEYHKRFGRVRFETRGGVKVRIPAIAIFSTARHFIETIPRMQQDGTGTDVKDGGDDHAYDSGAYELLSQPLSPENTKPKPRFDYDGSASRLHDDGGGYRDPITGY